MMLPPQSKEWRVRSGEVAGTVLSAKHHGELYKCPTYTLSEQLDIELATIMAWQNPETAAILRLFS